MALAFKAETINARQPQQFGELIEVPFINCEEARVYGGTEVIAPPGAYIVTPIAFVNYLNCN